VLNQDIPLPSREAVRAKRNRIGRPSTPHQCPECEKRRRQAIAAYWRNRDKRLERAKDYQKETYPRKRKQGE
jgi:hypothetical protein